MQVPNAAVLAAMMARDPSTDWKALGAAQQHDRLLQGWRRGNEPVCKAGASPGLPHDGVPTSSLMVAGGTLSDELVEYKKQQQMKPAEVQALRNHHKVKNWTKVGVLAAGWAATLSTCACPNRKLKPYMMISCCPILMDTT